MYRSTVCSVFMSASWYGLRLMKSRWLRASTCARGWRLKTSVREPSRSATTTRPQHASPLASRPCASMAPRGTSCGHFGAERTVLRYFHARDRASLWTGCRAHRRGLHGVVRLTRQSMSARTVSRGRRCMRQTAAARPVGPPAGPQLRHLKPLSAAVHCLRNGGGSDGLWKPHS